ncbi:hypothetical protein [Zoogloea sp.]|uniref:hypothetical protein n=1 Tax=Zoogloea sp. TaxID=49181 RepID=UPI0035B0DA86
MTDTPPRRTRRTYSETFKHALIEACGAPGASVAGLTQLRLEILSQDGLAGGLCAFCTCFIVYTKILAPACG